MVHPPSTIKSPSRPRKLQEWSSKDKNDIYERRQSGENWKSIEKDYPSRTGNALRLKYSEVKAQKLAGDDKPIKRQRKRRYTARKQPPLLDKPDSITSSSELSDVDDETTLTSHHPQSSSRSTPNPARTEEWISTSPNLEADNTAKSQIVGEQPEEPDTSLANVADGETMTDAVSLQWPLKKKRKLSTEPSKSSAQSFTSCSMHLPAQHSTSVVESSKLCTDPADDVMISGLLSTLEATLNDTKARLYDTFKARLDDTFRARTAAFEAAKDRRQAVSDAASGRANRRANEAEQELEKEREQYLAITRSNEQRLAEYENAKTVAEQSAQDAQAIIESKDERLVELESLVLAAVDREQEVKAINEGLRKMVFEKDSELAEKEHQLKLYDQLRDLLCSEIGKLTEAQKQVEGILEAIKGHQAGFRRVWKLLNTASPFDKLLRSVEELKTECEGVQPWLDVMVTRWQAATDAFANFRTQFTSAGANERSSAAGACAENTGNKD